jgi:hypothetical protein
MTHVLETFDPENDVYAKGQPEWEKANLTEMDSLLKNITLDLLP